MYLNYLLNIHVPKKMIVWDPQIVVFKFSDNAYDPDVSASELLIEKEDIGNIPSLIFLDNGAGMDSDKLLKMLRSVYI